jgi:sugar/nucleoside kinase (ribokinase family)
VIGRIDTVEPGDSFLAGLAASLAVGAEPVEAAQVGNFVAAVTITAWSDRTQRQGTK